MILTLYWGHRLGWREIRAAALCEKITYTTEKQRWVTRKLSRAVMAGRRSPLPAENYTKSVCSLLVSIAAARNGVTQCSPRRGGSIAWLRAERLRRRLILCIIVLSGSKIKTSSLNLPFFKLNPCKKVTRRGSGITIRKISLGRFISETRNWTEPRFMLFKWHFLTIC